MSDCHYFSYHVGSRAGRAARRGADGWGHRRGRARRPAFGAHDR
eukprot:gene50296-12553_t